MTPLFMVYDPEGRHILLYRETWEEHVLVRHPELSGQHEAVKTTITNPLLIDSNPRQAGFMYISYPGIISAFPSLSVFAPTKLISSGAFLVTTAYIASTRKTSKGGPSK
jgi:hypothetical protein